eukprot:4829007-Lingulodinium_polyedra.AAC.1
MGIFDAPLPAPTPPSQQMPEQPAQPPGDAWESELVHELMRDLGLEEGALPEPDIQCPLASMLPQEDMDELDRILEE